MELLAIVLLIASVGLSNVLCFLIGAKTGQKVVNNEPVKLPTINPAKIYNEHQEQKKLQQEIDEVSKSLANIDNYGSDEPQIDI